MYGDELASHRLKLTIYKLVTISANGPRSPAHMRKTIQDHLQLREIFTNSEQVQ